MDGEFLERPPPSALGIDLDCGEAQQVTAAVERLMGGALHMAGLHVTVDDLTGAFESARTFLSERGLSSGLGANRRVS